MGQNGQAAMTIPAQERVGFDTFALDDFAPLVQAHQQRIARTRTTLCYRRFKEISTARCRRRSPPQC
jgi:hypothetical protein